MQVENNVLENTRTIPMSLQKVIDEIEHTQDVSIGKLKKVLKNANIQEEELIPWADFEHSPADSYGRNMVYDGGFFEIMVMSWIPDDFSAIHDHGYTQWGVVQIFGEAEHAVFFAQDAEIRTLSRNIVKPKQVVGVGHELLHQMGNPSDKPFLSLHIYGNTDRHGGITDDARIFDVEHSEILRTSGGIFFGLPQDKINCVEKGACPDFITRLRDQTEQIKRIQKAEEAGKYQGYKELNPLIERFFDPTQFEDFVENIEEYLDENQQNNHSAYWKLLNWELTEASKLQDRLLKQEKSGDNFQNYAEVYDEVIGIPTLDSFMKNYLSFFARNYMADIENKTLLSIGCGTALVEEWMLQNLGLQNENLYGIDISEAMISVACQRIHAEIGDALTLDPAVRMWDLTFCGLSVFQYVTHDKLEKVIEKTAQVTNKGGYFIGDFITPDHIRWYPNVIKSQNKAIISVHSPKLIEQENHLYQENQVFNVQATQGKFRISNDGTHQRFLPPISRVRQYFEKTFKGKVELFDAVSLKLIQENDDTCPSARYIVIAQKA